MLSLKEYITEGKEEYPFSEELKEYKSNPNVFFTFNNIQNTTQNKNLHETTPTGIWCYNLKMAISRYEILEKGMGKIPFSFHSSSIKLFEIPWETKIVSGKNYTEEDFERDFKILEEKYSTKEDWDKIVKDSFAQYFNERLWLMVKNLSNDSKTMNKIIDLLGYDGFTDYYGSGYIHRKEKFITLIVNKSVIDFIKTVKI